MARRSKKTSSSGNKKLPIYIAAGGVGLLCVVLLIQKRSSSSKNTESNFPVAPYMERASNLRDNDYVLQGKVIDRTPSPSNDAELISVRMKDNTVLPIVVPAKAKSVNIEREQEFVFYVTVKDVTPQCKGIIFATNVTAAAN